MRKSTVIQETNQNSALEIKERVHEIRSLLEDGMQTAIMNLIYRLFNDEVEKLCGDDHQRKGDVLLYRGGSEKKSYVYIDGQRLPVKRPRVKNENENEVPLKSYLAMQDFDMLSEDVKRMVIRGISTRNYKGAVKTIANGLGLQRSLVSNAFKKASEKDLNEINGRNLSWWKWTAIFIDGIEFGGVHLIVALGVTWYGQKMILGIREGSTENAQLCIDLVNSLTERGFKIEKKILAVLDGSKALHSAVEKLWGDAVYIQRCMLHKRRNVLDKLPKSMQTEAKRRYDAAMNLVEYESARKEMEKVIVWLRGISDEAARSLEEGFEELFTVHKLGLPAAMRKTFITTNPIESPFATVREMTNRVKNWKKGKEQASRWAASSLLIVEKNFRKIRGYKQMKVLREALTGIKEDEKVEITERKVQ